MIAPGELFEGDVDGEPVGNGIVPSAVDVARPGGRTEKGIAPGRDKTG